MTESNMLYGIHAVKELLENRIQEIDRIYFDTETVKGSAFFLLKLARKNKIPCQVIPAIKIDQIAGTTKHQGVVALCTIKPYDEIETVYARLDTITEPPLLLVPASIEDPRNLGALIRTAVGFGVHAMLLERKQTVSLNATVAKTSAGMVEHMSIVKPKSLEKVLTNLKEKKYQIIGAEAGSDKSPADVDLTGPVILVTGGEHRGIPPYLNRLCTDIVTIPMAPPVTSLNVSVAASILLYECIRQRGFGNIVKK